MTSREVAGIFQEIETLLDLHGESEFKSKAYGRAARALETSGGDIEAIVASGGDLQIPGVGKGLAAEVREIVLSGFSSQLDELREATPKGLIEILRIRGLGAKKVRAIHQQLGVDTLAGLESAAQDGSLAALSGFGKKSAENILKGLEELKQNLGKVRINVATQVGERLLGFLAELPEVECASPVGRLRCGSEEFDRISLLAATSDPKRVIAAITATELLDACTEIDDGVEGTSPELLKVMIHLCTPELYPVRLHRLTGAHDHCFMVGIPLADRGYEIRDDGLFRDGAPVHVESEEELYALAGMQFVPPEIRTGIDEVRLALDGELPELIEAAPLQGMLHVHSTWSDGRHPLAEVAEFVRELGYRYLLICDHSKSAFYANGLDETRLAAQGEEIDELNQGYDPSEFRVLKGTECDILADGTLDFDDDTLASLDAVVASIHSRFDLPVEQQTERLCRAIENPYVTILGHPTGRLILKRHGYDIDHRAVIDTAARCNTSIEINANPLRLDLRWRMVRYAIRQGVQISVNPDAHSLADYANMPYGITMARKGYVTKETCLNTKNLAEFMEFARGIPVR